MNNCAPCGAADGGLSNYLSSHRPANSPSSALLLKQSDLALIE